MLHDLFILGAKIIIACRDTRRGNETVEEIQEKVPNANVTVKHLDLAAFSSIRRFADEILRTEPQINILINNAGKHFFNYY